jgi:hypothetical protein
VRLRLILLATASCLLLAGDGVGFTGGVNFVVLRVTFSDFGNGTRFTTAQTQANFNSIAQLWGTDSSYGKINLNYQFAGPFQVASPSTTYLNDGGGNSSTTAAIVQLVNDAVAGSPNTINWGGVLGVVVLFADTRTNGFYRGITLPGTTPISPPSGGSFNVHASIVGESPSEDLARTWGRWAHEMGHQMQGNPGNPWHPSNYNSNFEEMDAEYPAQTGVFFKQSGKAFPDWLPPTKYKLVSPPAGASLGLLVEERSPASEPDLQAAKALLTFGGQQIYYLVSARRRILGDDTATTHGPNGIPDEGVLIERVVEGGDPSLNDCPAPQTACPRWVDVRGNGNIDTLWHVGDTYRNQVDGIFITVRAKPDADHYLVDIAYADKAGQPDVGLNSWLQPPGNSYETTDIWVDSPVNAYGTYRYGTWSDLMGGTVPRGNGDDPAVGLSNRLYARVRNFGATPAVNAVVHFDVTNPLGLGINGSNGFVQLGTVTSAQFPGLASIPAGGFVDVYFNWTPNVQLTPAQIQAGHFDFHSCVRVRTDHVASETFFANQDGEGQQENIDYFDAGSAASPGAPGPANGDVIHLRNDSPSSPKQFFLSVLREKLPPSWTVTLNGGNPVVALGPGQKRDVPVKIRQTKKEPVGSTHSIRVFASSKVTLRSAAHPSDVHDAFIGLGGIQFKVAVLRRPTLQCRSSGDGVVVGKLSGVRDGRKKTLNISVVAVDSKNRFIPRASALASVPGNGGVFKAKFPRDIPPIKRAVCLFAGTTLDSRVSSPIFGVR